MAAIDRMLATLFGDPRPEERIIEENIRLRRHIRTLESRLGSAKARNAELRNAAAVDPNEHAQLKQAHEQLRARVDILRLEKRALVLEIERLRKGDEHNDGRASIDRGAGDARGA